MHACPTCQPTESYTSSPPLASDFVCNVHLSSCHVLAVSSPVSVVVVHLVVHLVVLLLHPVANKLEPANDLANREETDDLSRNNTSRQPLCP